MSQSIFKWMCLPSTGCPIRKAKFPPNLTLGTRWISNALNVKFGGEVRFLNWTPCTLLFPFPSYKVNYLQMHKSYQWNFGESSDRKSNFDVDTIKYDYRKSSNTSQSLIQAGSFSCFFRVSFWRKWWPPNPWNKLEARACIRRFTVTIHH
jgi:hypothetical protein